MEQVSQLFEFEKSLQHGQAKLVKINITEEQAMWANLRAVRDGGSIFAVNPGQYVQLIVDGTLYMSDTQMEQRSNLEFVRKAHGDVMIAGLGVGLIIWNLKSKIESGEVKSITVYEKFQDVIDLVTPIIKSWLPKDFKFEVICKDILTYDPDKTEKYDTIYFDIWPDICGDYYPEMADLHNRWKTHKRIGGWTDSWMKKVMLELHRQDEEDDEYYW